MQVAIFDFDGTLYEKETFNSLMQHLKEHPDYQAEYKKFYKEILLPYIGHKLKVYPTHRMRAYSMQLYMGALDRLSVNELNAFFSSLAQEMREDFNPLTIKRFEKHHNDNVYTMLVSGAYTDLLTQFKEEFPFDTIIGTDIPILDGEVNKTEQIEHIQGAQKNKKINESLKNKDIDWENSYAYADSFSDLSVLELVGNPVAVDPDEELRKVAIERNWEIIEVGQ